MWAGLRGADMSKVSPAQVSFNGGEISRRLRARIDQSLYAISVAECLGFAPLVEGPLEAMPGTLHIARAPGPCRLLRFEYSATQGQVVEASDALFRIYTNDALLTAGGAPVSIPSPYSYGEVLELKTHQSYDVLYCFHPAHRPREFVRSGATEFAFADLDLENGPFEPRNKDKGLYVSASGPSGAIALAASAPIFAATDVGGLFKIEAADFGDTPAWEPGITISSGEYRTSLERVYRCIRGGKTGSLQPSHTEAVEWDGMGEGQDINEEPAGGVQWEYVHDKVGICRITAFTDAQTVSAIVLRRLPFSSVRGTGGGEGTPYAGNYTYESRYGEDFDVTYTAPGVVYQYGTWRWSFGAFSDTRGWPTCGTIWNERLCLAKDSTVYGSVVGDLTDFAEINELGEVSNDMAFQRTLPDPNPIVEMAATEKLLLFTAQGCMALGPSSAAQGVGPKNVRADRQHHSGSGRQDSVPLNSRTLTISRCGTRIFETQYSAQRQVETASDLTRYSRHIGKPGFTELAQQQLPHNFVWAAMQDGSLACATYLPDEEVLGMARRKMAEGIVVRSLADITDPAGRFDQIWLAVERGGEWHVLLMAPWREDGDTDDTGTMTDMAAQYEGEERDSFTHPVLTNAALHVVADGRFYEVETDREGRFTLPFPHGRVTAGLAFPAAVETLNLEAGGDSGPARSKKARISRTYLEVLDSRGLAAGDPSAGELQDIVQTEPGNGERWEPFDGFHFIERSGNHTRDPKLRVERRAPFQCTIAAIGYQLEVQQR